MTAPIRGTGSGSEIGRRSYRWGHLVIHPWRTRIRIAKANQARQKATTPGISPTRR